MALCTVSIIPQEPFFIHLLQGNGTVQNVQSRSVLVLEWCQCRCGTARTACPFPLNPVLWTADAPPALHCTISPVVSVSIRKPCVRVFVTMHQYVSNSRLSRNFQASMRKGFKEYSNSCSRWYFHKGRLKWSAEEDIDASISYL